MLILCCLYVLLVREMVSWSCALCCFQALQGGLVPEAVVFYGRSFSSKTQQRNNLKIHTMTQILLLLCLSTVEDFVISQSNLSMFFGTVIESTVDILLKTVTMGTEICQETFSLLERSQAFTLLCFLVFSNPGPYWKYG